MANTKDDPYLALLKFGAKHLEQPCTFEEAKKHLERIGIKISEQHAVTLFFGAFQTVSTGERNTAISRRIEKRIPHVLTMESYFQLLEHNELTEARASSLAAQNSSRLAFLMSIGAIAIAILFGIAQLFFSGFESETQTLNETQFQQLITALEPAETGETTP